ncbi:hypothetical protein M1L60_08285 [Actinoplanes sp. TRM 88003]|uniref:Uncharacterized protein n=1 Tax=Paractinoplanes aksuensis TaxID=2939490 RepID=A0ABT1DKN6_9ACTN|nr:hypothetical protein [Actinoplanes aksuensis]MCO8270595.1 hypothetical protein [Actinoplanes aksuensis]
MNCPRCGTRLDHAGQGHPCHNGPVAGAQPPRHWRVALGAVVVLTLLFAAFSLLQAVITAGPLVIVLSLVVSVALGVSIIVWARLTKRVVETYGGRGTVIRNWAMYCGSVVLLLSVFLTASTSAVFHVGRATGALLFLVGVLISRAKLQRWLAEPHTPGEVRAEPPGAGAQPFHRPLLPPVEIQPRDWDASAWDPEIQQDIERRHRTHRT